ncbi:MAG: hypothetical protein DMG44_19265 [Acidobacteria bacterium]|nr:MAG: hypothetical protein DMG44_19265 [Acidobacteriota bacterium]
MGTTDWHKCKFLESVGNLKPLVKERFGREPSTTLAREIIACLLQGRLFYEAAVSSPLEIRPLQQFYGMIGFSKALIVSSQLKSLTTLRQSHGLRDISAGGSRIADLRVKIENAGTFQAFNDVVAALTRLSYIDSQTRSRRIAIPSASSAQLTGCELTLKDILARVPTLESLYRMTFGGDAQTASIDLQTGFQGEDQEFRIRIDDPEIVEDRATLKQIVDRWRSRFPLLQSWRLASAQQAWGNTVIYLRNTPSLGLDEFSDEYLALENGAFQERPIPGDQNQRFTLEQGIRPVAGGLGRRIYAMAPINDTYLSEFSVHYLGLFLLSSLVRYRPQAWAHAVSRSSFPGEPADDKSLSLIERFLDINQNEIPEMVVKVLNSNEDP